MKLDRVTIRGFRGFNSERSFDFHDKLTLVSAANSYGKTSLTEALEFLLYGQTSKVGSASFKDEYKDSYINRHHTADANAFVEAVLIDGDVRTTLRVNLASDGSVQRLLNGAPVTSWPFATELGTAARPFVVQHALKELLLSAPVDRFESFARLLGLQAVDEVQRALINLCTKPDVHIPKRAKELLQSLSTFDSRLKGVPELASVARDLAKGPSSVDGAFKKLHTRSEKLLGKRVDELNVRDALVSLRNAAASKVFSGSVSIATFSTIDQRTFDIARRDIEAGLTADFLANYRSVLGSDVDDRLQQIATLLDTGLSILADQPDNCPFCEQALTDDIRSHIQERHSEANRRLPSAVDRGALRTALLASLKGLRESITTHSTMLARRSKDLVDAGTKEKADQLKALIAKGNENALFLVAAGSATLAPLHRNVLEEADALHRRIGVCEDSLRTKSEDLAHLEAVAVALTTYREAASAYVRKLEEIAPTLSEPSRLLKEAVDAQAGTAEMSLLVELLEERANIWKAVRIQEVIDGLKDLRKHVDQAVGEAMESAFSADLTGAVMKWYGRIRTTGDPDVHFSGFAMERTKQGDFKNRRVRIGATSYGVALASAVSSLSESKLNALSLCVSIATALRAPGPWGFLILDDPIQSWDDDHEIQFIDIVRTLAEEEGKQIILLSHRDKWIASVAANCRSLNGIRYEITGYAKDGPMISTPEWAPIDQRLREILSIANDTTSSTVRLQQGEEEVRLAACQLAAEAATKLLGRATSGHSMNSKTVRSTLNDAGCDTTLVDRVVGTFVTTDDSHHAPKDYTPSRERLRQYHQTLTDLSKWLSSRTKKS